MLMFAFIIGVLIIPEEYLALYAIIFIISLIVSLVHKNFKKRKILVDNSI